MTGMLGVNANRPALTLLTEYCETYGLTRRHIAAQVQAPINTVESWFYGATPAATFRARIAAFTADAVPDTSWMATDDEAIAAELGMSVAEFLEVEASALAKLYHNACVRQIVCDELGGAE